ncbi:alkane 1-monooxygenase [Paracoccus jeotgali]|uniref:alkane 1-monooxygenase n=1 Tax=Paracoccus jeotgali TaxID=2065379 RepID=UPI0028AD657F|nr:alkane 1-monooxygenase [Paracoccus jeotgali]
MARRRGSHLVPPALAYAAAGILPAALLIRGAEVGGWPLWLGLLWMALLVPLADMLAGLSFGDAEEGQPFPATETGLTLLALTHFALLLSALSAFGGDELTLTERVVLFLGAGMWFGQVSNAVGHELIHRSRRSLFRLGAAIYVSLLFGHHVSAHRLVHHSHVATARDPNSARLGESFWRFFPRAWWGSFRQGLAAERARARLSRRLNPYLIWVGGAGLWIIGVWIGFGTRAMVDYLALCLYAQMQLLLSDYVQHYGLRRARIGDRVEPVGPRHSWDAPHALSSLGMVNAPRHSDHHAHPGRPYPALRLSPQDMRPLLPYPLPVMGAIAMVPPLWRRVMDHRVARMRAEPVGEDSKRP